MNLKQIKKLLYCLFFLAVTAIAVINVRIATQIEKGSKLALINISTLANAENSSGCESGVVISPGPTVAVTIYNKTTLEDDRDKGHYCFTDSDTSCQVTIQ
jgi:hypothetical protein